MNSIIEKNLNSIVELCKKHHVKELSVFGSALTNKFDENSDVDFLYLFDLNKIEHLEYADNYFSFRSSLEQVTGRTVDLVSQKDISNPVFKRMVEQSKVLLYAA
ncbi:MAG: nucleotidyltransferase domain-containing protein [Chitinophagaceae bacterium]|nr:nucleotidyltransferase domain-containing protein [Chitinophagaceae bacterium]